MNILTYIESRGGKVRPAGCEALSLARELADSSGGKSYGLLIGDNVESLAGDVKKFGIDKLILVENPELAGYSPEGYREAVLAAVAETGAEAVLLAASAMGRDLAPTLAARLDAGLLPDCVEAGYADGKLTVTRSVYAGRCMLELSATTMPVAISIRPKAFAIKERDESDLDIGKVNVDLGGKIRAKLLETKVEATGKIDVADADVIIAGGRGMKEADNFKLIEELAGILGGAIGASRAVVDTEWRPHSEQIGQTGKVVSPTLYIAAGISGAIQHMAGMRTSKVIVAINKDSEAPIFKSADYGIIGDAMEVLPALIEAVK